MDPLFPQRPFQLVCLVYRCNSSDIFQFSTWPSFPTRSSFVVIRIQSQIECVPCRDRERQRQNRRVYSRSGIQCCMPLSSSGVIQRSAKDIRFARTMVALWRSTLWPASTSVHRSPCSWTGGRQRRNGGTEVVSAQTMVAVAE